MKKTAAQQGEEKVTPEKSDNTSGLNKFLRHWTDWVLLIGLTHIIAWILVPPVRDERVSFTMFAVLVLTLLAWRLRSR
jgi:hypothetical protein